MSKQYEFHTHVCADDRAQVVVCGGGTAGAVAAIAAAREGMNVLIIEPFGCLGGSATNSLVTPLMTVGIPGNPMNSSISDEINRRSIEDGFAYQGGINPGYFDPSMMPFLLEQMAQESGVRIRYYTTPIHVIKENDKITALIVQDKAGLHAVEGEIFIDCTGDGDLSVLAGANYTKGNPKTGKNQPISLRYVLDDVDLKAFAGTVSDNSITSDGYSSCVKLHGDREVEKIMTRAMEAGDLTKEDLSYWQVFPLERAGRKGGLACNCPEFFEHVDGTDPAHLTETQILGKIAIRRHLAFYKKYFKGFENAHISNVSAMVGIRESREIETEQIMTFADAAVYRKFDDGIAQTNYPIDVHGMGDEYTCKTVKAEAVNEKPYYEIPYGSLVVKGVDNLLVAGRCIGCEFLVQASIRIQPTCRATGEAAGIAASMAIKNGVLPREINGCAVRARMIENGAVFAEG